MYFLLLFYLLFDLLILERSAAFISIHEETQNEVQNVKQQI